MGSWATLVGGFLFAVAGVARFVGRLGSPSSSVVARHLRGTFLVGLALCVTFTALLVVGGLSDGVVHDEDVVLLTLCWSVLTLISLVSRYIPAGNRRPGDA